MTNQQRIGLVQVDAVQDAPAARSGERAALQLCFGVQFLTPYPGYRRSQLSPSIGMLRCSLRIKAGGGGMLTVETIGRIRREHFIKGKTIRSDFRPNRSSVRSIIVLAAPTSA